MLQGLEASAYGRLEALNPKNAICGRKITENLADGEIYFPLFLLFSPKSRKFAQNLWF